MKWIKLANYPSGLEADMVAERLRGAGLHSRVQGNDVGIVGAGFQGVTARGFDVFVLDRELSRARTLLDDDREPDA
jgi:hypothetical protein